MEYETIIKLDKGVKPNRLYWRQRSFTIVWTHPMYVIKNYTIIYKNNKLQKVFISRAWHPNAGIPNTGIIPINTPPEKQDVCLPKWVVGIDMDHQIFENLENYILNRWWVDDPHHYPIYGKYFITNPSIENEYRR